MTLPNPFQDSLRFERRVPECTVVIYVECSSIGSCMSIASRPDFFARRY
jgi:hypothetical protein